MSGLIRSVLIALFAVTASIGSGDAAVPIDALVAPPQLTTPVLSPSGRYLAFGRRTSDGKSSVAVLDLDTPNAVPTGLILPLAGEVEWISWANEDRVLVATRFNFTVQVRRIRVTGEASTARVLAFDRDGKNVVVLLGEERQLRVREDLTEIVHPLPQDPLHVLMAAYDNSGRYNLYRVNVANGEAEIAERGEKHTFQWLADTQGQPRVRWDGRPRAQVEMRVRQSDGQWGLAARYDDRDYEQLKIIGFADDPSIAIVADRQGGDRLGVFEYHIAARTLGRALLTHPRVDVGWPVGDLLYDPYTTGLLGACFVDDVWFCRYFDPQLTRVQQRFEATFADSAIVRFSSFSQDRKRIVITTRGPRNPGAYFLYDAAKDSMNAIGKARPDLPAKELGDMLVVKYPARDGTKIPAYLTMPPGKGDKNLPLVVMPHGGPELRDYVDFDPWAQMLASRGFAVLQPNFRGSGGYGKSFTEAGHRQWGRLMQDDITDGVTALVKDGTADPNRVCIVGASYGGYAALAGGAFTPDLYKCVMSISGVSDVIKMIEEDRYHAGSDSYIYDYWKKWVGDPRSADAEQMKAISPINHAAKFKAPVLLVHGDQDNNVRSSQSIAMQKALKKAGKQVELVLVPEGHTFVSIASRKTLLTEMERFVTAHIGK